MDSTTPHPSSPARARPREAPAAAWHALEADDVLERLGTGREGLSPDEAARRLELHGPNELRPPRPTPAWRILWDQLRSLVVALLAAAAGVAWATGDRLEAASIVAVLVVNTILGFWTEWRARRAMEALRRLGLQQGRVVRDGRERTVDGRELVPGDVVVLEAGAAVPADARVLEATGLTVNEAALTGESVPSTKDPAPVGVDAPDAVPLAERACMVYKGTLVVDGAGVAAVTATGAGTEVGRIAELVAATGEEETPLEERLDRLGRRLVGLTLGVAGLVVAVGALRGQDLWLMVETGIALAIAAVPEGLPVVATITLAAGMRRMARRHALLRRLPAVETLGSTTVVCTDKTGTLTAGEMTLHRLLLPGGEAVEVTGSGYGPEGEFRRDGAPVDPLEDPTLRAALEVGALVNRSRVEEGPEGWTVTGDPTDAALLVAARKAGLEREALVETSPEVGQIPFSSARMYAATLHRGEGGGRVLHVKGAPDRVLPACTRALTAAGARALEAGEEEALLSAAGDMARDGYRVLALATRALPGEGAPVDQEAVRELTLVGLVGLVDPPAAGVEDTIRRLSTAGVRTVMITGDHPSTAAAVARWVGIDDRGVVSGREAEAEGPELARRVAEASVFARVSPEAKVRIVEALQGRGEVVGMLGDGVNDAAALKRADVGVVMGVRGTDVAKDTADVVLLDDRFETVAAAVEEGRVVFDNIRKFIFYLFSCNLAEVGTLLLAGVLGLPLPLRPLQLLWLNLVTDVFPALALAAEPAEPDVMRRPPRNPEAAILSRAFTLQITAFAVLLTGVTLGVFGGELAGGASEARAVTMAFMTLALAQLFHVLDARSRHPVLLSRRLLENGWVWAALALTGAAQVAAVQVPFLRRVLETAPLAPGDWAVCVGAALLPLLASQAWRLARHGRGAPPPREGGWAEGRSSA